MATARIDIININILIMNIGNGMHLIPAAELVGIPEWLSIKPYGNQWQAVGHYHPLPIPK